MLCPRLGDIYTRTMDVENILQECVNKTLNKTATKQLPILSLVSMKLSEMPELSLYPSFSTELLELNLSRNQLFNAEQVFTALSVLQGIKQLNLSNNFLNGTLPDCASALTTLENISLDVNQLTNLGSAVANWTNLVHFSCADNSLVELSEDVGAWSKVTHANFRVSYLSTLSLSFFFTPSYHYLFFPVISHPPLLYIRPCTPRFLF